MDVHDELIRWIIYLQDDATVVTCGKSTMAVSHEGEVKTFVTAYGKVVK